MHSQTGELVSAGGDPSTTSGGRASGLRDVFISYASEDEEFVDRLRGALGRRKREVWVYTEGILPADDWRPAAHEAIERSDALLFVISRASLTSGPCLGEVRYAFSLEKRVIPVCIEEAAKDEEKPDRLAAKAWIMMRAANQFDHMLEQVVEALDTDLELARTHTRILVRAQAWERGGRGKSPLFRGDELHEAKQWLTKAVRDGGPQPTQLQREFLDASAREATALRWRRAIIAGVVLAIGVVLAGAALILQGQSNTRGKIALSRQLANEASDGFANNRPDVGALLSLEAERSADTAEARSSLVRSVEAIPAGMIAFRPVPQRTTAAYAPDGRTVAFSTGELWDTRTGRVRPVAGLGGHSLMAFSRDGTLIAGASTSDGTVKLWNVASERLVRSMPTHADDVYSIAFTPDGTTLAAATSNGTIVRWNTKTGAPLGTPLHESFQVNAVAYSHNGALLAAGTPAGAVNVIDSLTGKSVSRFSVGQPVMQLAFSPDSRELGVATPAQVVLRNLRSGRERLLNAGSPPASARAMPQAGVAFSPTQPILATVSDTGNLMLWSSTTGQLLRTEPHDTGGEVVSFSPNGNTILTVDGAGEGIVWDTETELALGHAESSQAAQVVATAISPDGRLQAIGRDDGSLEVSDPQTGKVLWRWHSILPAPQSGDLGVATLAFSPNGHLLVSGDDQAVRLWNAQTGQPIRATSTDNGVSQVAFNPKGNLLAAAVNGDQTLLLLDGATGSPIRKLHVGASINGVAWLEGGRLAADSDRGTIILDARSGTTTHTIKGNADTTIASNPDGTILALLNYSGALALWNAATWKQLDSLSADNGLGSPGKLAFSQDGGTLATANTNGQAQLWDVASGQQLGSVLRVPQKTRAPTGVESLAFDPASSSLVMGTSDGTLVTFGPLPLSNVDTGTARYLCGVVRRSLTLAEWQQLVPRASYHATCAPFGYG